MAARLYAIIARYTSVIGGLDYATLVKQGIFKGQGQHRTLTFRGFL